MTRDQWLLTGAWAAMAATGAFSLYKVSESPKVDPTIAELADKLTKARGKEIPVPPMPPTFEPPRGPVAGYVTPEEPQTRFRSRLVGTPVDPKPITVQVLPFPVMGSATPDLNGVVVRWSTEQRAVPLLVKMTAVAAKPSGFSVWRQTGDQPKAKIADLPAGATSYTDLSAEPRQTYFYWVSLTGAETTRADRSGRMQETTNLADSPVKAVTPRNTRMTLIGGDRKHAVLKVETYDRAKKAWTGKTAMVSPGETIPGMGWSLKSLRFDEFTLVAGVTDDDGVAHDLTTRN